MLSGFYCTEMCGVNMWIGWCNAGSLKLIYFVTLNWTTVYPKQHSPTQFLSDYTPTASHAIC
jgi:hypothetical protein